MTSHLGSPARRGRRVLFGTAFLVAGLGGLAYSMQRTWDGSSQQIWPGLGPTVAATVLSMGALGALAIAWVRLVAVEGHAWVLARSVFVSQLGKYIPGGIWQAAGQVAFSLRTGISQRVLWQRYGGFLLLLIIAPTFVAAVGAPWFSLPGWVRALILLAPLSALLLHRSVFERVDDVVARWTRGRVVFDRSTPSGARPIALLACIVGIAAYGLSYAVILRSLDAQSDTIVATSAFAAAWLAGFVLVPLPAGLGVREATLVLALRDDAPTATILAASVVFRLVAMVGEVLLTAIASFVVWRQERSSRARRAS